MALLYQATLSPSKTEVLAAWVPRQPWLGGADASTLETVGAYRFDDPDGEVGIETHLLRAVDGQVLQVPVTYRDAPLTGAEAALITTTRHSVLGKRWVYDACGDPVYARALATTILTGGTQAELEVVTDTGSERRQATTRVSGSGSPGAAVPTVGSVTVTSAGTRTVITSGNLELVVLRVLDTTDSDATHTLVGTWPGRDSAALLAEASVS